MGIAKQLLKTKYIQTKTNIRPLAIKFFGNSATLAIKFESIKGEYRKTKAQHQCKHCVQTESHEEGIKVTILNERHWRAKMIGNIYVERCPLCWYNRVLRLCLQIEEEIKLNSIDDEMPLYYTEIEDPKQTAKDICNYNFKNPDGKIRYKVFPLRNGKYILVHNNQNELGGTPLPNERPALQDLMETWADTPNDKKIRGTQGWGGRFQYTKGDGRKTRKKKQEQEVEQESEEEKTLKVTIMNFKHLKRMVQIVFGVKLRAGKTNKGVSNSEVIALCRYLSIEHSIAQGKVNETEVQAIIDNWESEGKELTHNKENSELRTSEQESKKECPQLTISYENQSLKSQKVWKQGVLIPPLINNFPVTT